MGQDRLTFFLLTIITQLQLTFWTDNDHTTKANLVAEFVSRLLANESFAGIKGAVVGAGGQKKLQLDGPLSATLFSQGWISESNTKLAIEPGTNPAIETELGIIIGSPITERSVRCLTWRSPDGK